ncbi:hypothetical protein AC230_04450 [Streptomyces caatingaensis]|uniref:Uncharacterized protein n=1 Tax=Streptomyces caatingaensis TaxID=1678637 RepID=A0A0K9XL89_9ACTN|nr:hypothetical protein AC230_04450 [Streptomyces caatingaensis]
MGERVPHDAALGLVPLPQPVPQPGGDALLHGGAQDGDGPRRLDQPGAVVRGAGQRLLVGAADPGAHPGVRLRELPQAQAPVRLQEPREVRDAGGREGRFLGVQLGPARVGLLADEPHGPVQQPERAVAHRDGALPPEGLAQPRLGLREPPCPRGLFGGQRLARRPADHRLRGDRLHRRPGQREAGAQPGADRPDDVRPLGVRDPVGIGGEEDAARQHRAVEGVLQEGGQGQGHGHQRRGQHHRAVGGLGHHPADGPVVLRLPVGAGGVHDDEAVGERGGRDLDPQLRHQGGDPGARRQQGEQRAEFTRYLVVGAPLAQRGGQPLAGAAAVGTDRVPAGVAVQPHPEQRRRPVLDDDGGGGGRQHVGRQQRHAQQAVDEGALAAGELADDGQVRTVVRQPPVHLRQGRADGRRPLGGRPEAVDRPPDEVQVFRRVGQCLGDDGGVPGVRPSVPHAELPA